MIRHFTLECIEGRQKGQSFTFSGQGVYQIGRKRGCDLQLSDATVSIRHCTINADGQKILLTDEKSTNGTFVGGSRVRETLLQDGDEIVLGGRCRLRLSVYSENGTQADGSRIRESQETCRCEICGKSFPLSKRLEGLNICPQCMENNEEAVLHFLLASVPASNKDPVFPAIELPGYRHLRKLGEGSFGSVWLVEELATGKRMALKVMLEQVAERELERKKFDREISIASQLKHPNIVEQYDSRSEGERTYILQEYCAGGSLLSFIDHTYLRYGGKLPVELAVQIELQILDALDYAHNVEIRSQNAWGETEILHGVVHRDIHPGNIFLTGYDEQMQVKVGDWGLSKAYELAGLSGISIGDVLTGTKEFAPIQQHMNFRFSGPEVDVWSAAAVLFYMLTGRPPRERSGSIGRSWGDFPRVRPIRGLRPDLPAALADVLDYTLVEQPRLRVMSADALRRQIRDAVT